MHSVAEGVQPAERIDLDFVGVHEHHAAGADRSGKRAARDNSGPHGICGAVTGSANHHTVGRKAKLPGDCWHQLASHLLRLIAGGEE